MVNHSSNYDIALINNFAQLKIFLSKSRKCIDEKYYYLDLSNNSLLFSEILNQYGYNKLTENMNIHNSRDDFLKKYIELIDKISFNNNTRIWWGSELASKNRFTSHLPEILFQFIQSIHAIKKNDYDTLIIITTEQIVTKSLMNFLKHSNKKVFPNWFSILHKPFFLNYLKNLFQFDKTFFHLYLYKQAFILGKRSVWSRLKLKPTPNKKMFNSQKCYLIKSHVYEKSFDSSNNYKDQFFGKLPEFLSKKSNLIYFVHIFGNFNNVLKKIRNNTTHQLIPFEYYAHLRDILFAIIQISFGRVKMHDIKFYGLDVTDIVRAEFKRSGIQLYHWIMYESTRNFLKHFKFDTIYITYENIAWENMFIMSLKNYSHKTKIIGYQHSVVPQSMAAMFIGKREKKIKPLPDKLLTVGLETREILRDYGNYPRSMVDTGCALRYEYLEQIELKKIQRTNYILLALDGLTEASGMVNYVLKYVEKLKDYNFIIRTHPALPWEKIKNKINKDIDQIPNVSLSKHASLIDELNQVEICIYWGSTIALEALFMGIPIIHYNNQTILSYDPLFRCKHLKWIVTEDDSLRRVIESINLVPEEEYLYQVEQAHNYIRSYFYPVTDQNMSKFLYD